MSNDQSKPSAIPDPDDAAELERLASVFEKAAWPDGPASVPRSIWLSKVNRGLAAVFADLRAREAKEAKAAYPEPPGGWMFPRTAQPKPGPRHAYDPTAWEPAVGGSWSCLRRGSYFVSDDVPKSCQTCDLRARGNHSETPNSSSALTPAHTPEVVDEKARHLLRRIASALTAEASTEVNYNYLVTQSISGTPMADAMHGADHFDSPPALTPAQRDEVERIVRDMMKEQQR